MGRVWFLLLLPLFRLPPDQGASVPGPPGLAHQLWPAPQGLREPPGSQTPSGCPSGPRAFVCREVSAKPGSAMTTLVATHPAHTQNLKFQGRALASATTWSWSLTSQTGDRGQGDWPADSLTQHS